MEIIYKATATSTGDGREGHVESSTGRLNFDLRIPTAMGGRGGDYTNPEELFAAGYSACFHSALNLAARNSHKRVSGSAVRVTVGLGKSAESGFQLSARIEASIVGISLAEAEELLKMAHTICPYSKAIKGNVAVELVARERLDPTEEDSAQQNQTMRQKM